MTDSGALVALGKKFGMQRRQFITLLGGAAAWPLAARAQQAKVATIGLLGTGNAAAQSQWTAAFVQRMRDLGWVDGRNLTIEYRWAEGRSERFAEFAAEFVRLKVDVILTHNTPPVIAAKQATSVIPIVFATAADPVDTGLVASLARPGGNVTGLSSQTTDLASKRIELLREVVPGLRQLAFLSQPDNPYVVFDMRQAEAAARRLGLETASLEIRRAEDIGPTFEGLKGSAEALYILPDPLLFTHRLRINTLALGARLPTIHSLREYVEASGLMSYGPNWSDQWRRAADHVDKILRGAKPADLPMSNQPSSISSLI
jgi:ABC-type uncharacterized transport system substrate-binding protein